MKPLPDNECQFIRTSDQGWGQVHWYLYLRTLKYDFAVLILKPYISFMDVLVLVLKYNISMCFEYLMYLDVANNTDNK